MLDKDDKACKTSGEKADEIALVHLLLHIGKLNFDAHRRSDALEYFERAQELLDGFGYGSFGQPGYSPDTYRGTREGDARRKELKDEFDEVRANLLLHRAVLYRELRQYARALTLMDEAGKLAPVEASYRA